MAIVFVIAGELPARVKAIRDGCPACRFVLQDRSHFAVSQTGRALLQIFREIAEAVRPSRRAISYTSWPWTSSYAISSRSASDLYLHDDGLADGLIAAGGIPADSQNERLPTD